jgi:hypothetical protein
MADQPVVRTREEAKNLEPGQRVLVEVRGEFAAEVLWLDSMLENPDESEPGRAIKRLLAAEKRPG